MTASPEDSKNKPAKLNDGNNERSSWNVSMDAVVKSTEHYEPRGRKAIRGVFILATDPQFPVHVEDCCKDMGIAKNTFFDKLLKGRYLDPTTKEPRGPSVAQVERMESWISRRQTALEVLQQRRGIGKIPFIETPTARKVFAAGQIAIDFQTVVILLARSHVGKTVPVRQLAHTKNHGFSTYVECQSGSGVQGLCKLFCKARRISDKGGYDSLKERVIASIGYGDLVIVDEMTKLLSTYQKGSRLRALEFIRDIHDEKQTGMIWVVTKIWKDEVQRGELSKFLEQFNRRAPIEVDLGDMPLVGDARAFFHAYGLDFPPEFEGETWEALKRRYKDEVWSVCHDVLWYGGLKHFEICILAGRRLAEERGETFAHHHFVKRYRDLQILRQKPKT